MPHSSDMGSESRRVPKVGKVIDLGGYLAAERALDLVISTDPADALYPHRLAAATQLGASMLAVVARRLDAYRPEALESLGRAAAAYPVRAEAVAHLTRAANDRRIADARRLGAMLVLEYCLGVPPGDDYLATLRDPTTALALSFWGAARGAVRSPLLQSYVQAMLTQPSELLYGLFGRLVALEGDVPAEVARLLALHPDAELSLEIVDALAAQGSKAAVQCLAVLAPNVSPEASHAADRALRKLRLSGYSPRLLQPPVEGCRALLSPIDGRGYRLLVLVAPGSGSDSATMLELYLSDAEGLLEASTYAACGQADLPRTADMGRVHHYLPKGWVPGSAQITDAGSGNSPTVTFAMLEAPYLYGLDVLREAVRRNWLCVAPLPLEYALVSHLFWAHSDGLQEASFGVADEADIPHQLTPREADLLMNPAFDSWYLEGDAAREVAEDISALNGGPPKELTDDNWKLMLPALIRLAHDEFGPEVRVHYAARLRRMSEWLRLAGQDQEANCATSAARTMLKSPPETNLLVLRLVQRGILVALNRLASEGANSHAKKSKARSRKDA